LARTLVEAEASGGQAPALPEDEAQLSLTRLLRRQLSQVDTNSNRTWAQRVIEVWILEALEGNFRALQEILERVDGDPAGRVPAAPGPSLLEESTACRILEAICDPDDDPPNA
jgi:hypothetical protein